MHLWFALVVGITTIISYSEGKHPYSMEIERLNVISQTDPAWFGIGTLRAKKLNQNTYSMSGEVELLKNYGNGETLLLTIYNKNPINGDYFPVPLITYKGPVCEMYAKIDLVDDMIAASNAPPRGTCPIPSDKYVFDNFVLDPEKLPAHIPSGEYKILLTISKTNKLLFGYEVFVTVTAEAR